MKKMYWSLIIAGGLFTACTKEGNTPQEELRTVSIIPLDIKPVPEKIHLNNPFVSDAWQGKNLRSFRFSNEGIHVPVLDDPNQLNFSGIANIKPGVMKAGSWTFRSTVKILSEKGISPSVGIIADAGSNLRYITAGLKPNEQTGELNLEVTILDKEGNRRITSTYYGRNKDADAQITFSNRNGRLQISAYDATDSRHTYRRPSIDLGNVLPEYSGTGFGVWATGNGLIKSFMVFKQ